MGLPGNCLVGGCVERLDLLSCGSSCATSRFSSLARLNRPLLPQPRQLLPDLAVVPGCSWRAASNSRMATTSWSRAIAIWPAHRCGSGGLGKRAAASTHTRSATSASSWPWASRPATLMASPGVACLEAQRRTSFLICSSPGCGVLMRRAGRPPHRAWRCAGRAAPGRTRSTDAVRLAEQRAQVVDRAGAGGARGRADRRRGRRRGARSRGASAGRRRRATATARDDRLEIVDDAAAAVDGRPSFALGGAAGAQPAGHLVVARAHAGVAGLERHLEHERDQHLFVGAALAEGAARCARRRRAARRP